MYGVYLGFCEGKNEANQFLMKKEMLFGKDEEGAEH
jgi:hypothetical protein